MRQKNNERRKPPAATRGPSGRGDTKVRMSSTSVSNQRRASASSSLPIFRMALMPIKSGHGVRHEDRAVAVGPLGHGLSGFAQDGLRKSKSHWA